MRALAMSAADEDNPWTGAAEREPFDYTTREGAKALCAKIEAYWRERGLTVMLTLQSGGFHPAIRAARYDLRSDMVNGLPRCVAVPLAQGADEQTRDCD